MKVAIVHDWLTVYAGAERVLTEMLTLYPQADVFSVVDFMSDLDRRNINGKVATTTFIQKLPFARTKYRSFLPLMPIAIEQLDLSSYDLIISSSYAVAKGVLVGPDQVHVSYVHSPIRYAWDLQHQYLRESGLTSGIKSAFARWVLHRIRIWDTRTANSVDQFVANSFFVGRRLEKTYRRGCKVVYPPVDVSRFSLSDHKEEFYLTASRMVPYKRIPLIVSAFRGMPDKKLVVVGDGPDFVRAKDAAGANVELMGYQSDEVLRDLMMRAKAFVFAAEEDFGITPVEAQACGTPVIAFGKGGVLETVVSDGASRTGIFFSEQSEDSIRSAVIDFERDPSLYSATACRRNSEKYSAERFRLEFKGVVDDAVANFRLGSLGNTVSGVSSVVS